MRPHRWLSAFFAGLLILFGLVLLALIGLPYGMLKSWLGSLTSDGNFNSLKPENIVVFKALFAAGGLALFVFAALTGSRRWSFVGNFFRNLWADARTFLCGLFPSKKDVGPLAAVLLVMILAVVYRLEHITSPFHYDESYTVVVFSRSLWTAVTDYHLPNNHVLNSILVFLSTHIFGIQPWAVHLPVLVAGVLLVPAVYWLGRRLYDHWTGLAAALLVSLSPELIGYSTDARGYSLVALFTLLTLILGGYVLKKKNLFAWSLISILSALGFYTVPVMLFPFGVLFVWLFLENQVSGPGPYHSRWDFLRYWLAGGLGAALLTLLLYVPVLVYTGPAKLFANGFVSPLPWSDLFETLAARFGETWNRWIFKVPTVVVALLVAGWILSLIFHRRLSTRRVPLQLAAALWIVTLLFIQRPNAWSKVWVFLLPLMILWAASGTVGLLGLIRLKGRSQNYALGGRSNFGVGAKLLAAIVVCLAIGWGIWHAAWLAPQLPEIWSMRGDEENAVIFIQGQLTEGDKIVVDPSGDAQVWYYAELHGIDNAYFKTELAFTRLFVLVDPAEGQTLASVIAERGPDPALLDIESARQLDTFGKIQVFEVPRK